MTIADLEQKIKDLTYDARQESINLVQALDAQDWEKAAEAALWVYLPLQFSLYLRRLLQAIEEDNGESRTSRKLSSVSPVQAPDSTSSDARPGHVG